MKINSEWHLAHRMPKNATLDERIEWHIAHAKHCNCREMPEKLKEEMKKRNIKVPTKGKN
ncbi:MAG: hypothetical protein JSS82_04515 [Bacteroidetes bacterium]|nr:hypothetical protein [Bacteroidota bacterium]